MPRHCVRARPLVAAVLLAVAGFGSVSGSLAQQPGSTQPPGTQVPGTTRESDPDDVAFWGQIKDSQNPAQLEAYLLRFPNGTYADIARMRLGGLRNQTSSATPVMPPARNGAPPPAPPLPQGPQARTPISPGPGPQPEQPRQATAQQPVPGSVLTSPAAISDVQNLLYNLGFSLPVQRGALDDVTREAIRRFQSSARRPVTGDLTEPEVTFMRQVPVPSVWGAVAFSWNGSSGAVWERPDRRAAEVDALKLCETSGGQRCQTFAAHTSFCAAVAQSPGQDPSQQTGTFVAAGASQATAKAASDMILTECRARATNPETCTIRNTFCANGRHTR